MRLLCVDKVKEKYIREGIEDFCKRINYFGKFEILRIKPSNVEKEGKDLLSKINNEYVIALSEEGKEMDSEKFSKHINKINKDIVFIIGGSDGLSKLVKERCDELISLSKMTFTHEMAQLFLAEQIYRSHMIKSNRKYHR